MRGFGETEDLGFGESDTNTDSPFATANSLKPPKPPVNHNPRCRTPELQPLQINQLAPVPPSFDPC